MTVSAMSVLTSISRVNIGLSWTRYEVLRTKILEAISMRINVDSTGFQLALHYSAKFFGLAPFVRKNKKFEPASIFDKVYVMFLVALTIASTFIWYRASQSQTRNSLNNIVVSILLLCSGARAWVSQFTFAFKSDKITDILNKINAINDQLRSSDTQQTTGGNWKNIPVKMIVVNLTILTLECFVIYVTNRGDHSSIMKCFLWIGSIIMLIDSRSIIIIFVESLSRIRKNFKFLNEQLQNILRIKYEPLPSNDIRGSSIVPAARPQLQFSVKRFEKFRKLHQELSELVECTTSVMAVPIFFSGAYYISRMLLSCYVFYAVVSKLDSISVEHLVIIIEMFVPPIAVIMTELLVIADACSSTCKMANETNEVLIKVWNKFRPRESYDEFFMFSLQLLHSPVTVSAFGFLDLGYSFIYKILCAVVTYFVIMVQLDTSQKDHPT